MRRGAEVGWGQRVLVLCLWASPCVSGLPCRSRSHGRGVDHRRERAEGRRGAGPAGAELTARPADCLPGDLKIKPTGNPAEMVRGPTAGSPTEGAQQLAPSWCQTDVWCLAADFEKPRPSSHCFCVGKLCGISQRGSNVPPGPVASCFSCDPF